MTKKEKVQLYVYGDVPDTSVKYMTMFKNESMKHVSCLVKRFLELSPDFSSEDYNRVRVSQSNNQHRQYYKEYFIPLMEDIDILDINNDIKIKFLETKPAVKLED